MNYRSKYILILLFCFIFCLHHARAKQSNSQAGFLLLEKNDIRIIYSPADSAYAKQALNIIGKYLEEITADLLITERNTINVYIAPTRRNFRDFLRGQLPDWTGAFAAPSENTMYIRSPRWDQDNVFSTTLIHELFHLLLHQKMGLTEIPRWMNEGLAIFYSGDNKWIMSTAMSKALATRSLIPLSQIDNVLKFHSAKAELAYQESYSAVQYLLATYDIDAVLYILNGLKSNLSLDDCFKNATGSSFRDFELEWINYIKKHYKWTWISEFDNYIWILIIVLFLLAGILIRLRNRQKLREWQNETESE
ncbi:hypothetical protein JXQ31_16605 [candidate division KSB1 bacterium]|nr:hypothetical protein [candidate division KSB1 bacterium]